MSDPQQIAKNPPRSSPPKTERSYLPGRANRRFVALVLLIIVAPYLAMQIPREIGRWQLAQAILLREKGDKEPAYEKLTAAMRWFPQNAELLLTRAEWRLADGQRDEALADCDQMLDSSGENISALLLHANFLQEVGEFTRAVDDWKRIYDYSQRSGRPGRATALNGLAYAQAVAESELDAAFWYANEALELEPNSAHILDTRGYILHLQGIDDEALIDLDRAVAGIDELLKTPNYVEANEESTSQRRSGKLKTVQAMSDTKRAVAVVHYHRSQVLKALGRHEEAELELGLVRKLIGREPDKSLF
jgi:tetratricopeptide (TPR) repeat protein